MTAVRIWLPYNVYLVQPKKFLKDFARFINVIGELKLKAMVVLFNAWHGSPDFGGFRYESFPRMTKEALNGTFRFTDALLDRYAADERIFAWDLCNEPDTSGKTEVYQPWLTNLYNHIKTRKEKTWLTVGTFTIGALKTLAPITDVLSIHPYCNPSGDSKPNPDAHNNWVGQLIAVANEAGKPAVASETGWGVGADDAARAERLHIELGACVNHKAGFMVHALYHSPVADIHRPEYGPITGPGYMACIERDGSLRPGHEMIREYLRAK
jgi:endo-1,4-beta-mannosidase